MKLTSQMRSSVWFETSELADLSPSAWIECSRDQLTDGVGCRLLAIALVSTPHRSSHGCSSGKTEQRHHPQAKQR